MTNTIPNVPRELKPCPFCGGEPNLTTADYVHDDLTPMPVVECKSCSAWVQADDWNRRAPSPAGVDGLEVVQAVAWLNTATKEATTHPVVVMDWDDDKELVESLMTISKHEAIIDGLRGEVAEQEEAANQWRELALQFDRHRMTAMAHIRAAASGDKSAIEALGVFAALPPIPGHEITAERDRQAQRIGDLASHLEFAVTILTVAGLAGNAQVEAMRAALAAHRSTGVV